ncbi:MAG: nucleotide sugar dehydrogenase [Actinomycetota bacterium]|nr:nucleotide sugar dehydrogenase [Actinomycetota bacterium]
MKKTALLRRKILSRTASVGVVGQGYVGLSLACAAAEAGFHVVGIDVDEERIADLTAGRLSVPGVHESTFQTGLASGRLTFATTSALLEDVDIVAICVPTPLRDHSPDLSYVEGACTHVAKHLSPGRLVILESTTYPGTTDEIVKPLLETSGLVAAHDFLLAYSPERIDPGNVEYDFRNTPRVVGGITPEATGIASLFYGQLIDKVVSVSSCKAAELSKLLENTFRHVNIALVNEMAMLCHEMDMDIWEVVHAASTKPFGFMPFYPGPGVGGHCIPLDPTYLAWQVRRDSGHQFRILEEAQDINAQMPSYVTSRIGDALNEDKKSVKGARILVLGASYKADVGDVRESPALKIMALLMKRGARVSFHDPYLDSVVVNGEVIPRTELTHRAMSGADLVAVLTPHSAYDLDWIAGHAEIVFDARNAFAERERGKVVRL